jgi:hypothetical protein
LCADDYMSRGCCSLLTHGRGKDGISNWRTGGKMPLDTSIPEELLSQILNSKCIFFCFLESKVCTMLMCTCMYTRSTLMYISRV